MKKSKFTESQIVFALQQAETGIAVAEVCCKKEELGSFVVGYIRIRFSVFQNREFLAIIRRNRDVVIGIFMVPAAVLHGLGGVCRRITDRLSTTWTMNH